MGDGAAPVAPELKPLGSLLSQSFDGSVTIMARIRLAWIAFTKLQTAIFGIAGSLESKKIALRIAHTVHNTLACIVL